MDRNERNYGIEALRLYSMLLVVVLHILGVGGACENSSGIKASIMWLIESFAYCAIDIFGLISGFVGYKENSKCKTSKILLFWMQVFFWSFGLTFVFYITGLDDVNKAMLVRTAFPISTNQYWYVSSYFIILIFAPWINQFISQLDIKKHTYLVVIIFGLFSVYQIWPNIISNSDPFVLNSGYSPIWLLQLYIIGSWIKRSNLAKMINKYYACIAIIFCVLLSWGIHEITYTILPAKIFISYTSPTILLAAASYLISFSKMKMGEQFRKFITCFSSSAFGVYLIHAHPVIWNNYLRNAFVSLGNMNCFLIPIAVFAIASMVMLICLMSEKMRLGLFKIFKIDHFIVLVSERIELFVHLSINRLINRITIL